MTLDDHEGRRIIAVGPDDALVIAHEVLVQVAEPEVLIGRARERSDLADHFDSVEVEELDDDWHRFVFDGLQRTSAGVGSRLVGIIDRLSDLGFRAQPNHVFVTGSCGDGCGPHPADAMAAGFGADPFKSHPFKSHPFKSHPFKSHPFKSHGFGAAPFKSHDAPMSTAIPAGGRAFPPVELGPVGNPPRVLVLDTGLAAAGKSDALMERPNIGGDRTDVPDGPINNGMATTNAPADGYLDPVAGHGTFIAGIIEQLAPGCEITVRKIVSAMGFVDEADVVTEIKAAVEGQNPPDIISMSFGGTTLTDPKAMKSVINKATVQGTVVVASAGNSATCVPHFPAAMANVIAVGAIGHEGPAPWTNYGKWVDACAPGVDLVSVFFKDFNGTVSLVNGVDIDEFDGWAVWSGTSFSTPMVVAALARTMILGSATVEEAVERVIHDAHLMRLPCLGTVVNY